MAPRDTEQSELKRTKQARGTQKIMLRRSKESELLDGHADKIFGNQHHTKIYNIIATPLTDLSKLLELDSSLIHL